MAQHRLHREIAVLEHQFEVHYEPAARTVVVTDLALPDGFTPSTVEIRIRLPEHWPATPPHIELPWTVRYNGLVPRRWLIDTRWLVRASHLGDPFVYYPEATSLPAAVNEVVDDCAACTDTPAMDTETDNQHAERDQ
ncbi:hypothetical protein [Natrinema sp. 1APR25-10V2]|uniref:hypothetical protein n=1 Tax=Natrinema sp. 1APR25-10V2 TaxID=2951081 RepID=UPI00287557A7|nr:hypothetical protein [Natrinema sp. 1APR25-10V2]MDS0476807.1 hypothetical protein [Natrinema sp. 1APR25-10V2]